MVLPNFLIIGAGKSGTTSLHQWLREHPDVYLPRLKEPFYLTYDPDDPRVQGWPFPITTLEAYEALFDEVTTEKAIGEATPAYLESPIAADRIQELLTNPRFIVSLREHVDRVYSHAQMAVRLGEATDVVAEARRRASLEEHRYASKLRAWFDRFGRDRFCVLLYDDLVADPIAVCATAFRFLEVDDTFRPDTDVVHNPGGVPRSRRVQRLLEARSLRALRPLIPERAMGLVARVRSANLRQADSLTTDLRAELAASFRDDVLATQDLIDRDLSAWLR